MNSRNLKETRTAPPYWQRAAMLSGKRRLTTGEGQCQSRLHVNTKTEARPTGTENEDPGTVQESADPGSAINSRRDAAKKSREGRDSEGQRKN